MYQAFLQKFSFKFTRYPQVSIPFKVKESNVHKVVDFLRIIEQSD